MFIFKFNMLKVKATIKTRVPNIKEKLLTFKLLSITATDDILIFILLKVNKVWHFTQKIHMKCQVLFSQKNYKQNKKKNRMSSATILLNALCVISILFRVVVFF